MCLPAPGGPLRARCAGSGRGTRGTGRPPGSATHSRSPCPGVLFAQKPVVHLLAGPAPPSMGGSASGSSSSHCSPSPTSSRGTPSAEPSTSWSL